MDHEISTDREHRRLQDRAKNLRDAAKAARNVACPLVGRQILAVRLAPVITDAAPHAHGSQDFRIAPPRRSERGPASLQSAQLP